MHLWFDFLHAAQRSRNIFLKNKKLPECIRKLKQRFFSHKSVLFPWFADFYFLHLTKSANVIKTNRFSTFDRKELKTQIFRIGSGWVPDKKYTWQNTELQHFEEQFWF